jgi:hypothetical protein
LKSIHFCFDRILSGEEKIRAMELAIKENKKNSPVIHKMLGMSMHPAKMALLAGKMWKRGRKLGIYFLDGSKIQRQKASQHAVQWLNYANVQFDFSVPRANSDIRISFQSDPGSWSYIGTDNLGIPKMSRP